MDRHLVFFLVLLFVTGIVAQPDVIPDNNQTTTVTASTTTALETTTETSSSTTTSTTQKTTKPTTTAPTTPAPSEKYFYNVTDPVTNTTCIMVDGEMFFNINYTLNTNGTSEQTVTVPKPSKDVSVSGTCKAADDTQNITISWGAKKEFINSVSFIFNASEDGIHWHIISYTAEITLDETFKNASDEGKTLSLAIDLDLAPVEIPVNNSFKCYSRISASNVTAKIDEAPYIYPVAAGMDGIQIQAFNYIPKEESFVFAVHCDADKTSDIVPIAVGCALAGLVIIVLIAYLVGRRRRSAAYQSV